MAKGSKSSLVLAGASTVGRGTPWGTLCEVVAKALSPLGYECRIEPKAWSQENGRFVADGRADIGAWHLTNLQAAFYGTGVYAKEGRRENLRIIANVCLPSWLGVGVRSETGISDLSEVAKNKIPVRVRSGNGGLIGSVLDHYGLSDGRLESWGGALTPTHVLHGDPGSKPVVEPDLVDWVESGEFEVIVDSIYNGYAPEIPHWSQATILYDMSFLPLADELVKRATQANLGTPGFIPHRLMRGVWFDVPTIARLPHAIYCRADTPEDLVLDVARALDEHRELFRECHLSYSYDPAYVAREFGVPFHPAALQYYKEVGSVS